MKKLICIMSLLLLLASCVYAEEITTEVLLKSDSSWDGNALPSYPAGKPEITILKITIPPGTQLPLHKHLFINAGVLVSGELTVNTEDNKTLHVKAGTALNEVVDKWHYGKNEGSSPAQIIVVYAGVKDAPITIKKKE